jgi:hypothetical protein
MGNQGRQENSRKDAKAQRKSSLKGLGGFARDIRSSGVPGKQLSLNKIGASADVRPR